MSTLNNSVFEFRRDLDTPPILNERNYSIWKVQMRVFIQAQNLRLWHIIMKGYSNPTRIIDGLETSKPKKNWNRKEKEMAKLNSQAREIILSSLSREGQIRVSTCITAKETWEKLEEIFDKSFQCSSTSTSECENISTSEMVVTLNDSSESYGNEVTNLCLMAKDEECSIKLSQNELPIDELSKAYEMLKLDFDKLIKKNEKLKKSLKTLIDELKILQENFEEVIEENEAFELENKDLQDKVNELTQIVAKVTNDEEKLELRLNANNSSSHKSQEGRKDILERRPTTRHFHLPRFSHSYYSSTSRKKKFKMAWVPKEMLHEAIDYKSKGVWVPKALVHHIS